MGLDTILVLAMTGIAVVCFVWVEIKSRRNVRAEKQAEANASASSGAAKTGTDPLT